MNHNQVLRRIWLSDQSFSRIWGNQTPDKRQECIERLNRAGKGTDVMFRVADATLNIDFLAYVKALFDEDPETESDGHSHQVICISIYYKHVVHTQIAVTHHIQTPPDSYVSKRFLQGQAKWLFQAIEDAKKEETEFNQDNMSNTIQQFLEWYTESFDPFFHPMRFKGRVPDPDESERSRRDFVTQVTCGRWARL